MYRADILQELGKTPPRSWAEYQQLAEELSAYLANPANSAADQEKASAKKPAQPTLAAIEPLASGWGAKLLLARAAAYGRHRDNYSTLFRMDTMEPLIAGPPFVQALDELVKIAKLGKSPMPTGLTPEGVQTAVLSGKAVMGLTWSSPAKAFSTEASAPALPAGAAIRFAELPGALRSYNVAVNAWESRTADESPHVTLLDSSGMIGSVLTATEHPDAAFRVLAWLSGPNWSPRVLATSARTTLFRHSHLIDSKQWVNSLLDPAAAGSYGEVVQSSLSRESYLFVPRIPGAEMYLSALDAAVLRAVIENVSAQDALNEAAVAWVRITQRLGLKDQRNAYQRELGLNP
jgi:multiple sugar transport system substrate-binding protein